MNNLDSPKDPIDNQAEKNCRKLSPCRISACLGACLAALVLAVVALIFGFGGVILNSYCKSKAERAFAEANPGFVLRLGELNYSLAANRLVVQSVTLSATNMMLKTDRISLTGVRWSRLLWGTASLPDLLAQASLDATNFNVQIPQARYEIRCTRLRASVPGSELIAEGSELQTLAGDEAFFAAFDFRHTRFHVVVPECKVLGVAYGELLQGKSYRANSVQVSGPSFEALVNRDKAVAPFVKSPLMVIEALAAIRQPLQIDSLNITNGTVRYCERLVAGAEPGVLTIGAVNASVEGIANRGGPSAAIRLRGQGELMDAGTMKVQMSIPIAPSDFSLRYSGSLGAMDLTRLGAFLEIAENTRIKSGHVREGAFEIEVAAGHAHGQVQGQYENLEIAFLDKQTGNEKGLDHRVASFLMNALKIRSSNALEATGSKKEGEVNYTKAADDQFQQFAWFALRTGVLDLISH
jgi:hypothetical protein